ncbi:epsin-2-like [Oppia nitens]|uniref:epsin-2-like n=1 Tax=Oppia nitens TaxID=1686743 RepID=UPI0023DA2315|nr:epsin-2-like [Oppia nitens]
MMNVRGINRNLKNVVKNYSDAQVKVREATSNDPWGPSSTLMSEIADLTYNVVAFSEIMQMIWKRLNDHGKNWRHVYKALVLLEYLIKTGSEKVAQQCRENIFAIQTLKDFQYIEENKDQGMNVREKSKLLVALLKDDDKLKNERTRALKAKERFAQSMSYMGSSGNIGESLPRSSSSYHESLSSSGDHSLSAAARAAQLASELENARPQTLGEEELQLQLALAMSKEEAEQEERVRKNDDIRLQLAISESEKSKMKIQEDKRSHVDELLSLNIGPTVTSLPTDPWGQPLNNTTTSPTFGGNGLLASPPQASKVKDPWGVPQPQAMSAPLIDNKAGGDPWSTQMSQSRPMSAQNDPWNSSLTTTPTNMDPWGSANNNDMLSSPVFDSKPMNGSSISPTSEMNIRKTPENFLGANSNLVNLDALISTKPSSVLPMGGNPFAPSSSSTTTTTTTSSTLQGNPFQAAKPPPPTINQLRAQNQFSAPFDSNSALNTNLTPQPMFQLQQQTTNNLNTGLPSFPTNFPQQTTQTHNPFAM